VSTGEKDQLEVQLRLALKALMELMFEKGLVTRAELRARMEAISGLTVKSSAPQELWTSPEGTPLPLQVDAYERQLVEEALKKTKGVQTAAARLLGINKDRMKYLCRKHRINIRSLRRSLTTPGDQFPSP